MNSDLILSLFEKELEKEMKDSARDALNKMSHNDMDGYFFNSGYYEALKSIEYILEKLKEEYKDS